MGEILQIGVPLHFTDALHRLRSGRPCGPGRPVDLLLVHGERGGVLRHVHWAGHFLHTIARRPKENLQGKSLFVALQLEAVF